MNQRKTLKRRLFDMVPRYNNSLYRFCARYVDRFNGDNNSDSETNGEHFFLRSELPGLGSGVVFDVGANVGNWASYALSVNREIELHCFEPSKATYARLAEKRWPSNVHINNLGLGEVEGVETLHVVANESALNSMYVRRGTESGQPATVESVSITTVDDYCTKNGITRIDLAKIDVEGYEYRVLKGMSKTLTRGFVRTIQFEYGGCNLDARVTLGDIWHFLELHRFKLHKLYPEGLRRVEKYRQSLETFKYSNWVAIHETRDERRS
jgi:FkbM family methyltransferase